MTLNFPSEELFWIIQAMILQCVKLHRDLCWPLASKLAKESTCFHHYGIKSSKMKIGSMTIEILKDLITFQKIAIWSKHAIIDIVVLSQYQACKLHVSISNIQGSQTKIWSLWKVLNYRCHTNIVNYPFQPYKKHCDMPSMEDFDKPAVKLEITLICMSFTLLMLGRAYFILMCICEIKTKTKTWHEAVVQLTSYKKCLDACNHYLPSWKETLNVT